MTNGYVHTSKCNSITLRGNAKQIADKYTELAKQSERDGDAVLAERYRQQSEHYVRMHNGGRA